MYALTLVIGIILIVGAVVFGRMRSWFLMATCVIGALVFMAFTIEGDGESYYVPLERANCTVQVRSYEKYDLKCAVAFGELIPLVNNNRNALSGMDINWNSGGVFSKSVGDTIFVYRMAGIVTKPWSVDTTFYLCVSDVKDVAHEYDLFLQHLKKGTKEESIDTP